MDPKGILHSGVRLSFGFVALLLLLGGCYPWYEPYPAVHDRKVKFEESPDFVQNAFRQRYKNVVIESVIERKFRGEVINYTFLVAFPDQKKATVLVRVKGERVKDIGVVEQKGE